MSRRVLLVPVEVKARELTAKMALSMAAVRHGWTVFLGRSGAVHCLADYVAPAVYLEKNLHPARATLFERLRRHGHAVLALEEEGLAVLNYDWYVVKNIQKDMLARVDRFFAWGEMEAEAIRRHHPDLADRVVVTGNPRADLMRPEWCSVIIREGETYRQRHGCYILVNSSFSRVNLHAGTLDDFARNVVKRLSLAESDAEFLRRSLDHTNTIFRAFKEIVPYLARAFPDVPLIVRPHPSERQETWHEIAAQVANVHVAAEGTAIGWIAGASAFVHNGCTTAVEAALLRLWPIAYRPVRSERFDVPLPNQVSKEAVTPDDLVALVGRQLRGEVWPYDPQRDALLRRAVANVTGRSACDLILDVAESLRPPTASRRESIFSFRLHRSAQRLRSYGLKLGVRVLSGAAPEPSAKGKFDGASLGELQGLGSALSDGASPAAITEIDRECWRIAPA